jgi:ATP-binding cassette subfamily F protein 3
MPQALGRALVDFGGAIVLISHDRHLLRSVCDELLIVRDGTVDRFDLGLDDYPAWLAERAAVSAPQVPPPGDSGDGLNRAASGSPAINRRQQRQLEAQRRDRLKPLTNRVREIESRLATQREVLDALERQLGDPGLYTDAGRSSEIAELTQRRSEVHDLVEHLESDWLEASSELEHATKRTGS